MSEWRTIPVDATTEMIDAAERVEDEGFAAMHRAMCDAAPAAPERQSGTLVRLHVPHWFAAGDFQAWFNQNLGKGLASWQPMTQPLQQMALSADQCGSYAERLNRLMIKTDVMAQADSDLADCRAQQANRRGEALHALTRTLELLQHAQATNEGLTLTLGRIIDHLLKVSVLDNEALLVPQTESDQLAVEAAVSLLNELRKAATTADEDATISTMEYADCFVSVDPSCNGEGQESDMPEPYWSQIVEAARKARTGSEQTNIIVQLSPA